MADDISGTESKEEAKKLAIEAAFILLRNSLANRIASATQKILLFAAIGFALAFLLDGGRSEATHSLLVGLFLTAAGWVVFKMASSPCLGSFGAIFVYFGGLSRTEARLAVGRAISDRLDEQRRKNERGDTAVSAYDHETDNPKERLDALGDLAAAYLFVGLRRMP